MSKERRRKAVSGVACPCCGKLRDVQQQENLLAVQQAFSDGWTCEGNDWAVRYARARQIRWACDACLRAGRALEGKPHKQTFVDHEPYLAYFDRVYTCDDCHAEFVFSAREQQYWYEDLKFWVQSYPKQCLTCRRKRRARQRAMRAIQEQLSQLDPRNPHQLLHLASLYLAAGSLQKTGEYLARARRRAVERGELPALADEIEKLQEILERIQGARR